MKHNLTKERIENSYEWKLIQKILKKEFPWIKNIRIDEKTLDQFSLLFVDVDINSKLFQKIYNVEEKNYINHAKHNLGGVFWSPFLHLGFDMDRDDALQIANKVVQTMDSVRESKALPDDLKLPKHSGWAIDCFYFE